MRSLLIAGALTCLAATAASAQSKFAGTVLFSAAGTQQMLPVGDRPEHSMGLAQRTGTWTKGGQLGSDKAKEGTSTETDDVVGTPLHARGVHVATMESGDKYFVAFLGTGTLKDGKLLSEKGARPFSR